MLKLKYLYENFNLAKMMVKDFKHDDLEIFKYFRISSNAIYPFKDNEKVKYLRLSPIEEKNHQQIICEMDILNFLEDKKFPAVRAVKSNNNEFVVKRETPFGEYFATVLERVPGECVEELELTYELVYKLGKSLAELHKILPGIKSKRDSFKDKFIWMKKELVSLNDIKALNKLEILEADFEELELTSENYGLIHYDYELDNLFYDKDADTVYPIDFDDSMYHLYSMDILQALNSFEDKRDEFERSFLEGYESEKDVPKDYKREVELCRSFANLYSYTRVKRSIHEKWDNEPEWMVSLRRKLEKR